MSRKKEDYQLPKHNVLEETINHLIDEYNSGVSKRELQKRYGVSRANLEGIFYRNKDKIKTSRPTETHQQIIDLAEQGFMSYEICKKLNISNQLLEYYKKRYNIELVAPKFGKKLPQDKIDKARELYYEGESMKAISRIVGRSYKTIINWRTRFNWERKEENDNRTEENNNNE